MWKTKNRRQCASSNRIDSNQHCASVRQTTRRPSSKTKSALVPLFILSRRCAWGVCVACRSAFVNTIRFHSVAQSLTGEINWGRTMFVYYTYAGDTICRTSPAPPRARRNNALRSSGAKNELAAEHASILPARPIVRVLARVCAP